jgi:hypothetical protein
LVVAENVEFYDPSNCKEAMSSFDAVNWTAAMEENIITFQRNQIWTLIEAPKRKKLLVINECSKRKMILLELDTEQD